MTRTLKTIYQVDEALFVIYFFDIIWKHTGKQWLMSRNVERNDKLMQPQPLSRQQNFHII